MQGSPKQCPGQVQAEGGLAHAGQRVKQQQQKQLRQCQCADIIKALCLKPTTGNPTACCVASVSRLRATMQLSEGQHGQNHAGTA